MYIPCCLKILGYIPNLLNNSIVITNNMNNSSILKSGVNRLSCTYVNWCSDNGQSSIHPQTYDVLTKEIILKARIHNHPKLNIYGSHNSKLNQNPLYKSILELADINNYEYSTLFLRKIKLKNIENINELFNNWKKLILNIKEE